MIMTAASMLDLIRCEEFKIWYCIQEMWWAFICKIKCENEYVHVWKFQISNDCYDSTLQGPSVYSWPWLFL